MSKDLDSTTILDLLNDAARKHGMEEIESVENISQEWGATLMGKLVESLNVGDKEDTFPSQQPSFEVMRDFTNLRVNEVVRPEYINWAVKYLGHDESLLVSKDWIPVVGDVMVICDAIMKFADDMRGKNGDE